MTVPTAHTDCCVVEVQTVGKNTENLKFKESTRTWASGRSYLIHWSNLGKLTLICSIIFPSAAVRQGCVRESRKSTGERQHAMGIHQRPAKHEHPRFSMQSSCSSKKLLWGGRCYSSFSTGAFSSIRIVSIFSRTYILRHGR